MTLFTCLPHVHPGLQRTLISPPCARFLVVHFAGDTLYASDYFWVNPFLIYLGIPFPVGASVRVCHCGTYSVQSHLVLRHWLSLLMSGVNVCMRIGSPQVHISAPIYLCRCPWIAPVASETTRITSAMMTRKRMALLISLSIMASCRLGSVQLAYRLADLAHP